MAAYEKSHGKKPKLMVVSNIDYIGYALTNTLGPAQKALGELGVQIITGDYLEQGEVDLAAGIKEEE